jgi:hypothetical protein
VKVPPRSVPLLAGAGLVAVLVGFGVGRRSPVKLGTSSPAAPPVRFETAVVEGDSLVLHVPHAEGNIVLDGDMDDPGWIRASARTHAFVGADGVTAARPYSEARFVWADGFLYVGLYAADEDLRAKSSEHDVPVEGDDVFHVVFSDGKLDRVMDLNPLGTLTDGTRPSGTNDLLDRSWESGAHVSHEIDGTPNVLGDHDEEWVIEMAIPFESLGLRGETGERIGVALRRCDTIKNGVTVCGTFGEGTPGEGPALQGSKKGLLVLD